MNFKAIVAVQRVTTEVGKPYAEHFVADLSVVCQDCQLPFHFPGIQAGFSYLEPRVNIDGTELRVPLVPGPDLRTWRTGARVQ